MTRKMHRTLLCTLGAVALGVGFAGLAWACTPKAYIDPISPAAVKEGSTITVTGRGFIPGAVQIRIDSGPVLATATGPTFAVDVKIPKATPGVYYLSAVAYESNGEVVGESTRALEVIPTVAPKASEAVPSPVPSSEPSRAPARERPRATPEPKPSTEPRTTPATSAPAAAQAPSEGDTAAPARAPVQAESPARAKRPAKGPDKAKGASEAAAPRPAAITPLVTSLRSPWSGQPNAGPGLQAASASAKPSGDITSLGLGLLVLGLAVLGGAGFALVRARPRPPAPEASAALTTAPEASAALTTAPAAGASAMPVAVPPSLEEELQELIAESAAREEPAEPVGSEEPAPRELAGAPR